MLLCFVYLLSYFCSAGRFFALVKLSIDVPDLCVNHFGKIVGRGGTVIFVCYFIVRPFLTCFLVRG